MTPLANPRTNAEIAYNYSHIRTRQVIERTFGIWKRRFAVLSIPMRSRITLIQEIIIATAILHNIAVLNREHHHDEQGDPIDNLEDEIDHQEQMQPAVNLTQQQIVNYFHALL